MNKASRSLATSAGLLALTGLMMVIYGLYALLNAQIVIDWSTATELNTAGYAIYRADAPEGPFEKISTDLIAASSDPLSGGDYTYVDLDVRPGQTYFYELEEIETSGASSREGPIEATASWRGLAEGAFGLLLLAAAVYTRRLARSQAGPEIP